MELIQQNVHNIERSISPFLKIPNISIASSQQASYKSHVGPIYGCAFSSFELIQHISCSSKKKIPKLNSWKEKKSSPKKYIAIIYNLSFYFCIIRQIMKDYIQTTSTAWAVDFTISDKIFLRLYTLLETPPPLKYTHYDILWSKGMTKSYCIICTIWSHIHKQVILHCVLSPCGKKH